jgi:guanylate kinase
MPTPAAPQPPGLLLVISGPSGAGKTTIAHEVEHALGGVFSVSLTTRAKAAKDVEGRDYHFVTPPEFIRRRDAGELLEWAEVYPGCFYGTPRRPVEAALAAGKLMILEIDVEGGIAVKRLLPQAFSIFVLPPSEATLLQRLRDRKREDEAAIQRRFAKAKWEIARARESRAYDYFFINDQLDQAVAVAIAAVRERRGA